MTNLKAVEGKKTIPFLRLSTSLEKGYAIKGSFYSDLNVNL